jgi:hypothetical protein
MWKTDTYTDLASSIKTMFLNNEFATPLSSELPIVIIVDGFNIVQGAKDLEEQLLLPLPLPAGLCVVLSSKDEQNYIQDLICNEEKYGDLAKTSLIKTLPPLDKDTRRAIIEIKLGMFNKRLHPTQMELILANPGTVILEWLYFACEELRVFGAFETITERIKTLPPDVLGLLHEQLARNLLTASSYRDGSTATMIKDTLLMLLACDNDGLSEKELMILLAHSRNLIVPVEGEEQPTPEPLAYSEWSIVNIFLSSLVRQIPKKDGTHILIIKTSEIRRVIIEYFQSDNQDPTLSWEKIMRGYSKRLADYFGTCTGHRLMYSYPLQLIQIDDVARIKMFVNHPEFERVTDSLRMRIISTIRCRNTFNSTGPGLQGKAERYCMGCAMKIAGNKSRIQSCYVSLSIPSHLVKARINKFLTFIL